MFTALFGRLASWVETAYFHNVLEESAEGVLEATRWGWLPALSGVAIARDHAVAAQDVMEGRVDGGRNGAFVFLNTLFVG